MAPKKKTSGRKSSKSAPARSAVVVLGMHRSGTSALAGVLSRLGCDLPATEMPTTPSNPKGFYESNEIYLLNNSLLESAGLDWKDWQPFPPNWGRSQRAAEFSKRAAEVFARDFGTSTLLVMKDPRLCRLFPIWQQVLKDAGCAPAIVLIHRNPLEVATSLEVRNKLPKSTGLMIWLRYVLDGEVNTRGLPRSFTSYPRLLQNWKREIDQIEADLDLVFPRRSLKSAADIDKFLSGDLKHYDYGFDEISANPLVTNWVSETYEILERWAAEGEADADQKKLDEINSAFSASAPIYGPIINHFQIDSGTPAKLKQARKDLEEQKVEQETLLANAQNEQITLEQENRTIRQQIEEINDQLDALKSEYGSTRTALESRIKTLTGEAAGLHKQLEETSAELRATKDEIATTKSALIQRQHDSDEAHNEIRALKAQIEILKADCEAARDEPNPDQVKAIADLENALKARDQEIDRHLREKSSLSGQLQTRYHELGQLAQLIKSLETRNSETEQAAQSQVRQLQENAAQTAETVRRLEDQVQREVESANQLKQTHIREMEEIRTALAQVASEREYLHHAVEKMRASTSWRITDPLRRIMRILRRDKV